MLFNNKKDVIISEQSINDLLQFRDLMTSKIAMKNKSADADSNPASTSRLDSNLLGKDDTRSVGDVLGDPADGVVDETQIVCRPEESTNSICKTPPISRFRSENLGKSTQKQPFPDRSKSSSSLVIRSFNLTQAQNPTNGVTKSQKLQLVFPDNEDDMFDTLEFSKETNLYGVGKPFVERKSSGSNFGQSGTSLVSNNIESLGNVSRNREKPLSFNTNTSSTSGNRSNQLQKENISDHKRPSSCTNSASQNSIWSTGKKYYTQEEIEKKRLEALKRKKK